ncbi:MAG: S41 family peptidase [Pseudomonadota bacterium]
MKSWLSGVGVGAIMGATLVGFSAFAWPDAPNDRSRTYGQLSLFAEILEQVQQKYVTDIDEGDAIEAAIDGMLSSLDPHSSYLSPEDYTNMQVQTSGEYGGLGIEVDMLDGIVRVVAPIDDTPASRAGLQTGDLLTAIDGNPIIGLTLTDAVRDMRGEVGTDITITVIREGREAFDVTLTRETIRPKSVVARIEADDIGYIRISTFNERTSELLEEAVRKIKKDVRKPRGIIVDLRNNGGGLLDQAIKVTETFLNGGEVVSTIGRHPGSIFRYKAKKGEAFKGIPIVVLINGGSASASEIVAGALQDRQRATVLGVTSFGKGSVQTVIPLGVERGGLRLTTARYYTPAGRSIQGTGIDPDIEVGARRYTEEEIERLNRRLFRSEADLPNALANEDAEEGEETDGRRKVSIPSDLPPEDYEGDDYQLDRAIEILQSGTGFASAQQRSG